MVKSKGCQVALNLLTDEFVKMQACIQCRCANKLCVAKGLVETKKIAKSINQKTEKKTKNELNSIQLENDKKETPIPQESPEEI